MPVGGGMRVVRLLKGVLVLAGVGWALIADAQTASPDKPPSNSHKAEKAQKGTSSAQGGARSATARAQGTAQGAKADRGLKTGAPGRVPNAAQKDSLGKKAAVSGAARHPTSSGSVVQARTAPRSTGGPARASYGQRAGLHDTADPLDLKSSVALVIDQDSQQVLFSKNPDAVLPIASITKLMTAMVVLEAGQSLDEQLSITQDDVDTEKGSGSRLRVGSFLSRGDMLHLALMASENRAANALGRHYPGGLTVFVDAMNRKARSLGMTNTRYVEPTGLSSANQSSAHDLSVLVRAASEHQLIRELSTTADASVNVGSRSMQFRNTNGLIRNPSWEIGLQKTGYISEAGRCVVMQAQLAGRKLIMVLLDSAGRYSRIGDAERLRNWITHSVPAAQAATAPASGG
ncbi:MAG: D-alanyl-D-alanine endopeptidase [Betaproteobacteria bacterium]